MSLSEGDRKSGKPRLLALACLAMVVSACTSTEATLDPAALSGAQAPQASAPVAASPAPAASNLPGTLPSSSVTKIQFEGLIGAPDTAVAQIASSLSQNAAANRFSIVPAGDPSAVYKLKGFASTSPEDGKTIVFYVWDVTNPGGVRVHRFSGQHSATGQGDGWLAVTASDLETIGNKSVSEFAAWLAKAPR